MAVSLLYHDSQLFT